MFFMASDEFTLASTSFSRSVTGLGAEGPGSCPEISRSAVVSAASDGAGEAAAGTDELAELPPAPVPDCPQTATRPTGRNRMSETTGRIFIKRIIGLLPTPCNIYFSIPYPESESTLPAACPLGSKPRSFLSCGRLLGRGRSMVAMQFRTHHVG